MANPFSSFSGWSRPGRQLNLLPNSPENTEKAYHAGDARAKRPADAHLADLSLFLPSPTRSHRSQGGRCGGHKCGQTTLPQAPRDARPDWEAPAFTKLPIANRTGSSASECGKRSPLAWSNRQHLASPYLSSAFHLKWRFRCRRGRTSNRNALQLKAAPLRFRTVRLLAGPGSLDSVWTSQRSRSLTSHCQQRPRSRDRPVSRPRSMAALSF